MITKYKKTKKVILFLGSNGQLGTEFKIQNNNLFYNIFTNKYNLDLLSNNLYFDFKKIVKNLKIDYIINCVAYTNVNEAENNPFYCNTLNYYSLIKLIELCNKENIILVNFSTDYVYDGKLNNKYKEEDEKNPLNIYGKSKYFADCLIKDTCRNYIIFRTSGLYGKYENNFIYSIIKKLLTNKDFYMVNNIVSCPTFTSDLVNIINQFIYRNYKSNIQEDLNICGEQEITWYEFSKKIQKLLNIQKNHIIPISQEEYFKFNSCAIRPLYSSLNCDKLKNKYNLEIKSDINNNINKVLEYIK